MQKRSLAFALLCALSATAAIAIAPACSSTGNPDDGSGGDNGEGAGATTGTGGTSSTGGAKAGVGAGGATSMTTGGSTSAGGSGAAGKPSLMVADGGGIDPDAYFANDPPPMTCDAGPNNMPPVIGGSVDCPSDKNREGCPCPTVGMKAACWPGLRADRGHGVCMDGMTTCNAVGEGQQGEWAPCTGYTLPEMGATEGAPACKCFSSGQWNIANVSPCFVTDADGHTIDGAISSKLDGTTISCGPPGMEGAPLKPADPIWSTDTLTVDCAGSFTLCFNLRAGDPKNPMATDCIVSTSCVQADYAMEGVAQTIPPIPGWATTTPAQVACAAQFSATGGYGEMTVKGTSVDCEEIDEHTFNILSYCPNSCNVANPPASCAQCQSSGSGSFGNLGRSTARGQVVR